MQVDVDGAVRIARLAKQFEWTGYVDDVTRFTEVAGWVSEWSGENGMTFQTNLEVVRPEARVFMRKRVFSDITMYVTEILDQSVPWVDSRESIVDSYAELVFALEPVLGAPTRTEPGVDAVMAWDASGISICLRSLSRSIVLELANPKF
ncbi:DUF6301 family protein [Nocardia sp. NPDC058176]|uniref:DUF6301 family protein n=1 Tax=Nocardia sp. NPDC058176 TaxID=3346368 RepID=UPI0036DBFDE8